MKAALTFLGLAFGWVGAAFSAGSGYGPTVTSGADRMTVSVGTAPPSLERVFAPAPGGGVTVMDSARGTLPSGSKIDFQVGRTVTQAAIAAGIRTIFGGGIPGLIITTGIPMIWEAMRDQGVEQGPGGTPVIDLGGPMETVGGLMIDFRTGEKMTPHSIASREAANYCASQSGGSYTCGIDSQTGSCSSGTCQFSWGATVRYASGSIAWTGGGNDSRPEVIDIRCPEVTSALPVTGSAPCKTSNRAPPSLTDIENAANKIPQVNLPPVAKEASDNIPGGLPTAPGAPSVGGPVEVSDPPQTTTRPDGSVETRQKKWDIEYPGGGVVTFKPRLVETGPGGTTTTEGDAPTAGGDNRTQCEKDPTVIGCAKFGDITSGSVDRKTETIGFEEAPYPDGGSCPADVSMVALGTTYFVSWEPICGFASNYVRPVLLVMASAAAAFIFIGGLKA